MRKFNFSVVATSTIAIAVAAMATPAFAQSTGSADFDKTIVVTGAKSNKGIDGVNIPDTTKAKAELNQDWIEHQVGGQSVNDLINYLPGVSYTNNDPYGGTSGNLWIRGFDSSRISETFDGMTLNDDGGYALYGGELLDSEVIDKVTVNLGTTDVDSPTSSATGSTINFTSHMPSDKMGFRVNAGLGSDNYWRVFGMLETGEFTSAGTKAWISASDSKNDSPFNNYSKIDRHQFNGKLYQPLGSNGDFLSLAAFYVVLRNNFSGSDALAVTPYAADTGTGFTAFPSNYTNAFYTYTPCTTSTTATPNTCGTAFEYRPNPANLLNVRAAFKKTLADNLVFTLDPSYQFTKANGGGTAGMFESYKTIGADTTATGYIGGSYYLGEDLNGNGNMTDKVQMYVPSETKTHRVALTSSLRYDIAPTQSVRLAYAFARSMITQSGEATFLNSNGSPINVYATNAAVTDANGNLIEKRDTLSIAELNQISGEYRGQFFAKALTVNAGLRAPFLHRVLTNYCFTTSVSNVTCAFGASGTAFGNANPYSYNGVAPAGAAAPQTRKYNYSVVLPNIGFTYKLGNGHEAFFNYSKGFQAPQTTALYNSFYYPQGTAGAEPNPEKSDNFDLGYRFNDRKITAQVDLWYTHFTNRLGQAYDPIQQISIYENLGPVTRYGVDANVAYKIAPKVTAYAFASLIHSKIEGNVDNGACPAATATSVAVGQIVCVGSEGYLNTAGKVESAAPHLTLGGRLQGETGPFTLGVQAKYTGERYVNDENVGYYMGTTAATTSLQYPAKTAGYAIVDLDARFSLAKSGLGEKSYVQLNVTNLFNHFYVGSMSSTTNAVVGAGSYVNTAYVGAPRAFVASVNIAY